MIIMGEEEIKACNDAAALLENYRSFGPMVGDAIEAFQTIGECVEASTQEKIEEAKELIDKLMGEIGPYRGYVPTVAEALEKLKAWADSA